MADNTVQGAIQPPQPQPPPEGGETTLSRVKLKPTKMLPTDRLTHENQLSILRACVAASGNDRAAVSNADVERIANISSNSVSLCNNFFNEMGWTTRDGMKQRPNDPAVEYFQAFQWNPETAATKLAPTLAQSWFGKSLLSKLAYRSISKEEAIGFIADEAKASVEYRKSLEIAVEYLIAAGLAKLDGNTLVRVTPSAVTPASGTQPQGAEQNPQPSGQEQTPQGCETFTIPIPNKKSATVTFPSDLDAADWQMVTEMMAAYMKRLKGFEV